MQPETEVPEFPEWTYGDRLRKARESAGIDTQQMAQKMGVAPNVISQWERGRRHPRSAELIGVTQRWGDITNVPVEWLLGLAVKSFCFYPERPTALILPPGIRPLIERRRNQIRLITVRSDIAA